LSICTCKSNLKWIWHSVKPLGPAKVWTVKSCPGNPAYFPQQKTFKPNLSLFIDLYELLKFWSKLVYSDIIFLKKWVKNNVSYDFPGTLSMDFLSEFIWLLRNGKYTFCAKHCDDLTLRSKVIIFKDKTSKLKCFT
jgi:hypothetical protein